MPAYTNESDQRIEGTIERWMETARGAIDTIVNDGFRCRGALYDGWFGPQTASIVGWLAVHCRGLSAQPLADVYDIVESHDRGAPIPPKQEIEACLNRALVVVTTATAIIQTRRDAAAERGESGGTGDGTTKRPDGLRVVATERKAYWGDSALSINANSEFDILLRLDESFGEVVAHVDLLRAVKPGDVAASIENVRDAPPEVKLAIAGIRKAIRTVGANVAINPIRGIGYRLETSS